MKRAIVLSAVLVFFAATTHAISLGPSGRIYVQQNNVKPGDGSDYITLHSIEIDASWSFASFTTHGNILDNEDIGSEAYRLKIQSPEIETYGGTGFGTIVEGLYHQPGPAPAHAQGVMDVVRITPSAGGYSTTILGDGKAGTSGGLGGWSDWQTPTPSTEDGLFAMPDPQGTFAGADNYVIERADYNRSLFIVSDVNNDGDVTDDDEDYIDSLGRPHTFGHDSDYEIYGNKLYRSTGWGPNSADGVWYNQRGSIGTLVGFAYDGAGAGNVGIDIDADPGFAAGKINDHDAVWMIAAGQVYLFIDLDDNGSANGPGEVILSYHDDNASVHSEDNPDGEWRDLELITNEDGTMFLMALNTAGNWQIGRSIIIIELADNGVYAGGDGVRVIGERLVTGQQQFTMGAVRMMEFDSQLNVVIPEPATLLLLGTGALGVVGYIRRRRMR